MKTNELTGALLDYWVARALGYRFWKETRGASDPYTLCVLQKPGDREPWMRTQNWKAAKERYTEAHAFDDIQVGFFGAGVPAFSADWAQGGPIIERENISLRHEVHCGWGAHVSGQISESCFEPTPLIAAMRAYVASKFGDEVPDEPQNNEKQ
jgi:hypothetical protein